LVALLAATALALVMTLLARPKAAPKVALWVGAGYLSHLVLDTFTFNPDCAHEATHLYLLPLSLQSFELNCLWPGATFAMRVAIEVVYSAVLVSFALGLRRAIWTNVPWT
jgi:hypothetical protein